MELAKQNKTWGTPVANTARTTVDWLLCFPVNKLPSWAALIYTPKGDRVNGHNKAAQAGLQVEAGR